MNLRHETDLIFFFSGSQKRLLEFCISIGLIVCFSDDTVIINHINIRELNKHLYFCIYVYKEISICEIDFCYNMNHILFFIVI